MMMIKMMMMMPYMFNQNHRFQLMGKQNVYKMIKVLLY